jgi:site-specific DNA-cytosine methylase
MIENVRGLVTRHPRVFRAVLDACEAEYLTTWTILNAAHYGVPQNRERLFIDGFLDAADRARFRWPLPSHAPPGELFGAPHRTVREALNLGDGAFRAGPKENARSGQLQGMRLLDVDAPAYTIGGHSFDLLDRPAPCVTATEHKSAMRGTQPMNRRRRASERLSEALGSLDRPAPAVRPNAYHDAPDPERASRRPMAELSAALVAAGLADRQSTTVDTKPTLSRAGRGHRDPQKSGAVRLSPQQCAVLQAFPPGWTFTGNKSSQHRQIGNAVPPPLGEAVGRGIFAALRG